MKLIKYAILFLGVLMCPLYLNATEFNLAFIKGIKGESLEALTDGNTEQVYLVNIIFNGDDYGRSKIRLSNKNLNNVCLDKDLLEGKRIPIDFVKINFLYNKAENCYDFGLTEGGKAVLQKDQQILTLSLPQAYTKSLQKYEDLNYGDNGFKLKYSINSNNAFSDGAELASNDVYSFIDLDANIGRWVFNTRASGSSSSGFQSPQLSLSKVIYPLKGKFSVGKGTTNVSSFANFSYFGVSLQSKLNMWQSNKQGYAPIIEGNAATNSRVTIKQGKYILYSEIVPAGKYIFDEISPVYSGDITVVEESLASGLETTRIYPVSTLPTLLRPGRYNYDVVIGKKDDYEKGIDEDIFILGSFEYGFNDKTVGFSALLSESYFNLGANLTYSLGAYGAFYAGLNTSWTKIYANSYKTKFVRDNSINLEYSKGFGRSTNLRILGYHFIGDDYYEFNDDIDNNKVRERMEFSINHDFDAFRVNVSGINEKKQNGSLAKTMNLSFSSEIGSIAYNVNGYYSDNIDNEFGIGLNLSIPLSSFFGNTYLSTGTNYNSDGDLSAYASTSVSTGNVSHSFGVDADKNNKRYSFMSSARLDKTNLGLSITQAQESTSLGLSANGMIVGVEGLENLVYTSQQGKTIALAHIDNISGARFNYSNPTDENGNTVLSLNSYRENTINMHGDNLPSNIDIITQQRYLRPSEGGVFLLDFKYEKVRRYFLKVLDVNNNTLKAGAIAYTSDGRKLSIVDQNGVLVFSKNEEETDRIFIERRSGEPRCHFDINDLVYNKNVIQYISCKNN